MTYNEASVIRNISLTIWTSEWSKADAKDHFNSLKSQSAGQLSNDWESNYGACILWSRRTQSKTETLGERRTIPRRVVESDLFEVGYSIYSLTSIHAIQLNL